MSESVDADLIVVGGGLAGLAAANRALELGRSAVVLEASSEQKYPSASRLSGGVFHVGYRSVMAPPAELDTIIAAATGGFVKPALAQALSGNAARAIEWLKSAGAEFTRFEPDQGWRDYVLAPLGFHDQSHLVWEDLGADRLMQKLEAHLVERGGRLLRGTRVRELVMEGDRCRGVLAGERSWRGHGVLLADGGFQGNAELLRRYVTPHPEHLKLRGPAAGQGDGIRMGRQVGADLVGMPYFYGHVLSADSLTDDRLCPFPFLDFVSSAGMIVDERGERFVDEGKGGIHMANALARHRSGLATAIFDEAIWQGAGSFFFCPPNPNLVTAGGTLHRADDIETLARLAGLPPAALAATVAAYNAAVENGTPERLSPPRRTTKYAALPLRKPPFYAAPGCAAITHTAGGLAVDAAARVCRGDGSAIAGLYAAGSTCGGLEGGPEAGYMGGLIKALVFGLLAAESEARLRE